MRELIRWEIIRNKHHGESTSQTSWNPSLQKKKYPHIIYIYLSFNSSFSHQSRITLSLLLLTYLPFSSSFHCVVPLITTMPQVDLESLVSVCAGGDRKIACETLAGDDQPSDQPRRNPDSPPESIWLSRDEEYDWWDRNAVYERKESTKGNSNSSNSTNLNANSNSVSNSQRFSSIIGLPKPQKGSLYVDAKHRRSNKPGNVRLFPKRSSSVGKSEPAVIEPSSPKVSCMGRVKSKRDRNRRFRNSQAASSDTTGKPVRRYGFFEAIRAMFRSNRKGSPVHRGNHEPVDLHDKEGEAFTRASVSETEPPGLGGMNRFASGRRSEGWGLGGLEIHAAP